ncbi:MAG TPA: peptidylprolyl isomerase [Allosphingosinicella sp.]|jgi:peptidylprolyl isomerase|nr:peptidylprolyl isomerase [Allosphingosinicella sp.]
MRLKTLIALLLGLLLAGAVAAQMPDPPAPPPLDPENTLLLDLSNGGRVIVQLRPDVAPKHVERIKTLARRGFYNGLTFHRVIEGFMAQGGDPKGDGSGGSDLPNLPAEFSGLPHVRGAVSAARLGSPPNADEAAVKQAESSANSQFFIMLAPKLSLDGQYTVFGRVVGGMNYVDQIEKGEPPANPTRILQASIAADNRPPPTAEQVAAAATPTHSVPLLATGGPSSRAAGPAVPPPPAIKLPEPPQPHAKPHR